MWPPLFELEVSIRGGRFSFFFQIDMKGPYLANIGKNNHVLEEKKYS